MPPPASRSVTTVATSAVTAALRRPPLLLHVDSPGPAPRSVVLLSTAALTPSVLRFRHSRHGVVSRSAAVPRAAFVPPLWPGTPTTLRRLSQVAAATVTEPGATAVPAADGVRAPSITVGERASQRLNDINRRAAGVPPQALRLTVEAGGCYGYQYVMTLTQDAPTADDRVFERDGARVYVDEVSLGLVDGSTLEFVDELIGSSFQVIGNPNAESACGCKASFNLA
ncbi:Iron-sulfur cluster assembly 2, mitochondrial [Cladochytrium tenue]|nr:Iron-sulfur cluster assembly 2, mitochondrial [Cladochytrium tenue]